MPRLLCLGSHPELDTDPPSEEDARIEPLDSNPPGVAGAGRRLPRGVYHLALAMAINTMGFSIVLPYLSLYLHTVQHVPLRVVGAIYAAAGIAGALAMSVGGELTDRYGPRRVMIASLGLRSLNLAAMGWTVYVHGSLWLIAALVVGNGVFRSTFTPAANAAAAALAGPTRRLDAFATLRVGMNLGWVGGPALGGLMAEGSYARLFLLAAPLTLAALLTVARIGAAATAGPTQRIDWGSLWELRHDRRLLGFLLTGVLMMMLVGQLISTVTVYSEAVLDIPKVQIGLLYTVNALAVIALQTRVVRRIRAIGLRGALWVGPLTYATGYAAVGWVGASWGFAGMVGCMLVISFGEMFTMPAQLDAAVTLSDPARPGRALGLMGVVIALGTSFGPALGGFAYDHLKGHPRLLWASLALIGVVASASYAALLRPVAMRAKAAIKS